MFSYCRPAVTSLAKALRTVLHLFYQPREEQRDLRVRISASATGTGTVARRAVETWVLRHRPSNCQVDCKITRHGMGSRAIYHRYNLYHPQPHVNRTSDLCVCVRARVRLYLSAFVCMQSTDVAVSWDLYELNELHSWLHLSLYPSDWFTEKCMLMTKSQSATLTQFAFHLLHCLLMECLWPRPTFPFLLQINHKSRSLTGLPPFFFHLPTLKLFLVSLPFSFFDLLFSGYFVFIISSLQDHHYSISIGRRSICNPRFACPSVCRSPPHPG